MKLLVLHNDGDIRELDGFTATSQSTMFELMGLIANGSTVDAVRLYNHGRIVCTVTKGG